MTEGEGVSPVRGPWVPLPRSRRLGLRNSLRSDSPRPPNRFRDRGAAPPAGAMRCRQKLAHSSPFCHPRHF